MEVEDTKQRNGRRAHPIFSISIDKMIISWVVYHDLHGLQFYHFLRLKIQKKEMGRRARPVSSITIDKRSISQVVDHDLHGLQFYHFWRLKIQNKETGRLARAVSSSRANEAYVGVTFHTITDEWQLQHFVLENEELSEQHTAENIAEALESSPTVMEP